jgi:hypothetical protein
MTTDTILTFLFMFALACVIAWAAVFARGRLWRKIAALLALVALVPAIFVAVSELLGLPKPASTAWLENLTEYHRVIAYDVHESEAIFLWLDAGDGKEPRVFSIPYDKETLTRLQGAEDRASSLASDLLARVSQEQGTRTDRWKFTNQTEFARELPTKPTGDVNEGALEFDASDDSSADSSLGYGQP